MEEEGWVPDYEVEYEEEEEEYLEYTAEELEEYTAFIDDSEVQDEEWREGEWQGLLGVLSNPTNRSSTSTTTTHSVP